MDFTWLARYIMMHQAENQTFSYPFIIELKNKKKVVAWFWYDMSGTVDTQWFVQIRRIYVANENQKVTEYDIVFDVPAKYYDCSLAMMKDYMKDLELIYSDYSEDKMNILIQEKAYKPLFKAFRCVANYVQSKYTEV